jgi:hypothetical protein
MAATARKLGWRLSKVRRTCRSASDLPRDATFVVLSHADELAQTQVYPFHLWARVASRRYGAHLHEIALSDFIAAPPARPCPQVQWVAFQTGWDLSRQQMLTLIERIRHAFPVADLVYLDWFAPLDLRYAKVLDPYIVRYVKKQVYADFSRYGCPTLGDTNLTDYYGRRYGVSMPEVRFEVPRGFQRKLVLGTNFCVSPALLDAMRGRLRGDERPIDVHARIATHGTEWYRGMREEARKVAGAAMGLHTVCDGRVPRKTFFKELRSSKICFSPFGYGEVCWRDFEAIMSGALLLKPRMDHVKLAPEIFVPHETYVPIEWDYSNYEEQVRRYVADERRRLDICAYAFDRVRSYLRSDAGLASIQALFEPGGSPHLMRHALTAG